MSWPTQAVNQDARQAFDALDRAAKELATAIEAMSDMLKAANEKSVAHEWLAGDIASLAKAGERVQAAQIGLVRLTHGEVLTQNPKVAEAVAQAVERAVHDGRGNRQPTGIAAQLTDGEREKIGPEALQRMADVFNGPEAER